MNFSWDPAKEAANLRKHGVDFDTASKVFADSSCLIQQDRVVDGEQRWHAIGWVENTLILLVVHTVEVEDDEELEVRILSARKVTRHERREYERIAH